MTPLRYPIIVLLFFGISCSRKSSDEHKERIQKHEIWNNFGQGIVYNVNPFTGDSIELDDSKITGKYISLQPKTEQLRARPEIIPAGEPFFTGDGNELATLMPDTLASLWTEVGKIQKTTAKKGIPKRRRLRPIVVKASDMAFRDNALLDIRYLDIDQGLRSSYCRGIIQDSRGSFWFGSFDGGFCRYNGVDLEHYGAETGFHTIQDLQEDEEGNIWISPWSNQLFCYDGNFFYDYSRVLGFGKENSGSLSISSRGLIVTGEIETFWIVGEKNIEKYSLKPILSDSETLIDIREVSPEELLILTDQNVYSLKDDSVRRLKLFEGFHFFGMGVAEEGEVWLATDKGVLVLFRQHLVKLLAANGLPVSKVNAVLPFEKETYLGTDEGLVILKKHQARKIGETEGLTNESILSLHRDEHENIWLGTNGGGICRFNPESFHHFTKSNGLPQDIVKKILTRDNELWMGAYPGDLVKKITGGFQHFGRRDIHLSGSVFSAAFDSSRNLWFNSWGEAIYAFDGRKYLKYTANQGLHSGVVRDMKFDPAGNLWMATLSGVFILNNPGSSKESLTVLDPTNSFPDKRMTDICFRRNGEIWLASEGGISILESAKSNRVIHLTEREGLPNKSVTQLYEDSNGEMWVATDGGGISHIFGKKIRVIREEEGLSSSKVLGIVEDAEKRLWVSTTNGLNVIRHFEDSIAIQRFGKHDGLKGLDFFRGSIGIDNSNKLWLGSGKGVTMLNLSGFKENMTRPKVFISKIYVNERSMDSSVELAPEDKIRFEDYYIHPELSHGQNHLTFQFYGIAWNAPSEVRYSYRMLGLNDQWRSFSHDTKADFRSLPSGDYQFEVKAMTPDGQQSEVLTYVFSINPAWWNTWWARIIAGLFTLLAFFWISRMRVKRLKKRQMELEQTIAEKTADLQYEKLLVTEKNREILDSISYAKRIQDAILPPDELISEILPHTTLFYQPKDIVAGDFYWLEKIADYEILFAVADCTGHGVPGAMVSVVCNNALNRAVREFGLTEPAAILDKTRELILHEFERSAHDVKDGMDISLVYLNLNEKSLQWSGANNSLWILRNNGIIEIKADRQPIGKFEHSRPFTNHLFQLESNDYVILFTDGFQDQFGGEKGKKLKSKGLKDFLIENCPLSATDLGDKLRDFFSKWKGDNHQIDDVTVFVMKVD